MPTATVLTTIAAGVATIQIDRPAKKNALDAATYRGLTDALANAAAEPTVRVAILTGTREVFTAGNDLGDFARVRAGGGDLSASDFLRALIAFPKPLVAAVNGWAVGIGTTLLLHCDFAYAAPTARFRTPFVDLGVCPEAGSTVLLPRMIGPRRAHELIYLGREIDGTTAAAWGLVSEVADDPLARAQAVAAELAAKAPGAIRATKALLARATADELAAAMTAELAEFRARLVSDEAAEAAMALMARRRPDFTRFA
ncbi:MAG: enoyl-CoA hydratase/isomerase family protein [Myxococcales bacterium]|nr:enoyl-CoA hydratase/isomerase family protein [Myxococcales bacterium]